MHSVELALRIAKALEERPHAQEAAAMAFFQRKLWSGCCSVSRAADVAFEPMNGGMIVCELIHQRLGPPCCHPAPRVLFVANVV